MQRINKESARKKPKKVPKTLEFADTDLDDSDTQDEQEPAPKQAKKLPKSPRPLPGHGKSF